MRRKGAGVPEIRGKAEEREEEIGLKPNQKRVNKGRGRIIVWEKLRGHQCKPMGEHIQKPKMKERKDKREVVVRKFNQKEKAGRRKGGRK